MAARDVLKNLNLFVDGRGYAGQIQDYTPPVLTVQTEDWRGGGMDTPEALDMGMEALEASFNLISYDRDILNQFGVAEGNEIPLNARGALESVDGTVKQVIHKMRGKITSIDSGTWQPGQISPMQVTMRLNYYSLEHDGQTVHEIDTRRMIRIINGTDRLAEIREALGV
jgi:hypothetical protein